MKNNKWGAAVRTTCAAFFMLGASSASAALVTFELKSILTSLSVNSTALATYGAAPFANPSVGDTVTARYTFDSLASNQAGVPVYPMSGSGVSLQVIFGSATFSMGSYWVFADDGQTAPSFSSKDLYGFQAPSSTASAIPASAVNHATAAWSAMLYMETSVPFAVIGDQIPLTPPDLILFERRNLNVQYGWNVASPTCPTCSPQRIDFLTANALPVSLTAVPTPVPVPPALALLGSGIIFLGGVAARRRKTLSA